MSAPAQESIKTEPHNWTDGGDRVLILRRINADGTSYNGFDGWGEPTEIGKVVTCPDWEPQNKCGGGLHGWPWGMGLGDGHEYSIIDDRWLVVAARPEDVVGELENGQKCKAREVTKLYDGPFAGAWAMINGGRHRLIEAMSLQGTPGTAAGFSSKAASSGNYSKAASSGDSSKAEQTGKSGIAASIGDGGVVMAGELGCIIACYWSRRESRYRAVVGYVGEDGIKPGVRYRLNGDHKFEECL